MRGKISQIIFACVIAVIVPYACSTKNDPPVPNHGAKASFSTSGTSTSGTTSTSSTGTAPVNYLSYNSNTYNFTQVACGQQPGGYIMAGQIGPDSVLLV